MNKQPETAGRSGRKFLAGTALITSLVALFAAFLESWQLTAMVVAVAALGAAVMSFRRAS